MDVPALVTTTILLSRLKDSRDGEAWKAFDDRFRGVILATARKFGLSEADAADVAQESIFQSVRDYQAGRYDRSKGRLSTWILSIARHRIIDHVNRRRARDLASPDDHDSTAQRPEESDVQHALDDAIERQLFHKAWEQIRGNTQIAENTLKAFELTAIRRVPASAAAEQCDMTTEQVYVAKARVTQRLRELIEELSAAYRD